MTDLHCGMNIRDYAVIARPDPASASTANELRALLKTAGLREDSEAPDCVIVVGGDGTFLRAVHRYMPRLDGLVFIGIHSGTLGFFMDYRDSDLNAFAADIVGGRLTVEEHPIMEARVGQDTWCAVNEIRVENPVRTQDITVLINDEKFEEFRGSGLCVSSQLGSTAYNRSLGGAVLQKGLHAFEMTEIAGIHHSRFRSLGAPFVMADSTRISFVSDDFSGAVLGADSETVPLSGEGSVNILKSPDKKLRILRPRKVDYFERLRRLF